MRVLNWKLLIEPSLAPWLKEVWGLAFRVCGLGFSVSFRGLGFREGLERLINLRGRNACKMALCLSSDPFHGFDANTAPHCGVRARVCSDKKEQDRAAVHAPRTNPKP